tara:strand:- start:20 stop:268 length:249 start_codon:yes stop_codon:yes gene_type:complete
MTLGRAEDSGGSAAEPIEQVVQTETMTIPIQRLKETNPERSFICVLSMGSKFNGRQEKEKSIFMTQFNRSGDDSGSPVAQSL